MEKDNEVYSHIQGTMDSEEYLDGRLIKKESEEIDKTEKWDTINIKHSSDGKKPEREIVGYTETYSYFNGKFLGKHKSPIYRCEEMEEEVNKNISIGMINPAYIEVNELQDKDYEYKKISKFLKKYVEEYATKKGLNPKDLKLEFINYGKTELVYVLTEPSGERVTILTKQPAVEFGKVKQEAQNLKNLQKVDESVVAPIDYFKFGDQELYVTPYINQARCVASYGTWGMYVPEPFYRFVSFSKDQEEVVNACMIGKLVSLYDFKNKQGIASCKLGGGDFMLPKGWENEPLTVDDTLSKIRLIAAREMINCSFDEYLNLIRSEFSRRTIDEKQEDLLLNHRGRVPMDQNVIECGIALGKEIIDEREANKNKTADEIERAL